MLSASNIETPIDYSFEIYPFSDPLRTQVVVIENTITDNFIPDNAATVGTYYLESFSFSNDIFNPVQEGTARIAQFQYDEITFFQDVVEGDLLFIKENGANIFCGYIESLQLDVSASGTFITIIFVNFLKQLSRAKVFGLIFENLQPAQGARLDQFLDSIAVNSLIGIAQQNSNLFSFNIYQGIGEDSSLVLKNNSQVFLTITSFMNILQAINKVLYPYQRLIYQDALGNIAIAPLSLFDDMQWFFDQNRFTPTANTTPYVSLSIKKNAAATPNFEYATIFTIPQAQGVLSGNQSQKNSAWFCQYTPPSRYFTRLNQLYSSAFFTIADVIIEDTIIDPNKIDHTLNNIAELLQGSSTSKAANVTITAVNSTPNSQTPIPSENAENVDCSAILFNYTARAMAEHLVTETQVSITSMRIKQRDINGGLLQLPINRLVDVVLDDGILETSALFCRGYSFSYSASGGALVTLNCTKPLVGGAYWVNGQLISVGGISVV